MWPQCYANSGGNADGPVPAAEERRRRIAARGPNHRVTPLSTAWGKDSTMTSRHLRILVMATALSLTGCAVSDAGPAEFSFDRITISNPLTSTEDRIR